MALGAPQSITYTGVNITFAATTAFDAVTPGTRRFLWVKNGGGVSTSIVVVVPGATFGQNNPDVGVTIPAGEERMIGPIDPGLGDPAISGGVSFLTSPTASVTVAAVDLPSPPPDLP